jgi:fermentation-respiration switch protein FrsA (DUF1100 family)
MWMALRWSYSASGFLVTGIGLALLLDRYALRLLPWNPIAWKKEVCVRAGFFLGGAVAFYFLRPGIVPLREAAHRGLMVCLVAFLAERFPGLTSPTRSGWCLRGVLVALIILLIPLVAALHPLHTVPKRTPAALGLAFEDVRFRTTDGVELGAWLIPHPRPRGNFIFWHRHGRNRGHVGALWTTFHELGLNVLAFDFRGHGDSDGHTSAFGHREVEDLIAAEAYLSTRCPGQPLLLAGVSLGAAVALQTVPKLPNVRGVWSEGSFACLGNAVEYKFSPMPDLLRCPLVDFYYWLGWLDCGLWGPSVNPVVSLQGARVPIFFCHGRRDELVPFAEGETLYQAYGGPKGHWWVEGASHYDVQQRNHREYLRRLRTFLEECLAGIPPVPGNQRVQLGHRD